MQLWKESVNHLNKTISAVTKPLFRLLKFMILALPWSLTECPYAVSDESSDGLTVWCVGVLQVLLGLKGDELQKMLFWLGGNWEFLPR